MDRRTRGWQEIAAAPVEIGVFTRAESVAIRQAQVPSLPHAAAEGLAEVLGDLPLAAGYMADSGMPATEYRQLVITRAAAILAEGQVLSYSGTLASATQFAIERLARADPAAAMLAQICAVLAPEPIPLTLFTAACGHCLNRSAPRPQTRSGGGGC